MPILNYTTSIPVPQTVGEVSALLARRGVQRVSTTYDPTGTPDGISFVLTTEYGPREFLLPVHTDGVRKALQAEEASGAFSASRKKAGTFTTPEHAARVAWRIAKDWLETQLALIEVGMARMDQVMLPYMVTDASGRTVYDAYRARQGELET